MDLVVNGVNYNGVEAVAMQNTNGETVGFYPDAVRYNAQALSEGQKEQARSNIGATAGTKRYTVTLATDGWTAGSGYAYEQTVTISGATITADTDFDVDVEQGGTDAEADALVLAAFGLVTFADSVSGGIKFACPSELPDVNIPVNIRIYG